MVVLATFATIIASQALISGVFSLTRQAMQMGLSPRANIVPTSGDEAGQIYVPAANWLLMAGTLFTVLLFRSSENLASAYGIAVSGTMLITTILLYRVAVSRWGWKPALAIPVIAAFGAIDCFFLVSNSFKIVEGGWFPLVVGAAIATLMLTWRRGASEVKQRLAEMSMPLEEFIPYADNEVVGRAPGLGVWLTKVDHGASPMLLRHIEHNRVLHEKVVLLTFVSDRRPRVPFGERHSVHAPRPRLLPHPGPARLHADPGHSADPAELQPARLRCRSRAPELLHRPRDHRARREQIGDGADVVFDVLVSESHLQPRPGFFQDSAGRDYRGGISGEDLTAMQSCSRPSFETPLRGSSG